MTAIEVNFSCPDAEDAGLPFALDPRRADRVIAAVRDGARYDIPVFAELSPDVTDIVAVAGACVAAGADGLSLINTVLGMAIDPATMRPVLSGKYGGLSGPAIRPVAVRCGWQMQAAFPGVPIIGSGGCAPAGMPWSCCSPAPAWSRWVPRSCTIPRHARGCCGNWRRNWRPSARTGPPTWSARPIRSTARFPAA